jgi:adiponectin receptor
MASSYIVGVLIYVSRLPERWFPGRFDLLGNSHNIWHCFVVAAALFHYAGSVNAYHLRALLECPA